MGLTIPKVFSNRIDKNQDSGPVVISTWDHGKMANDSAWEVLSNGGTALDAVEKGVMVVENDPTGR